MAGHPTIGTTFALAHEGVIAPGRRTSCSSLASGRFRCRSSGTTTGCRFAWMTQPLPSFGAQIADRGGFAAAVGLRAGRPRGPADRGSVVRRRRSCSCRSRRGRRSTAWRSTGARWRASTSRRRATTCAVFFFTTDRTGATATKPSTAACWRPVRHRRRSGHRRRERAARLATCSTTAWSAPRRRDRWSACRAWP